MPNQGEEFYNLSNPTFLQQGDIFPNVPLISLSPSTELVVLRVPGSREYQPELFPGQVEAVREKAVDAFEGGRPEHIAVSAERGSGILVTQTCDLDDSDYWLVSPIYELADTEVSRGNLFAGKYAKLYGLLKHPDDYLPESYIDLSDLRPVRRGSIGIEDRIASLARSAQNALSEQLGRSLSRPWGFAPGEFVPARGKYRCNQCNKYFGIRNPEQEFRAGGKFPECENCKKVHKTASWYPLVKHKKS